MIKRACMLVALFGLLFQAVYNHAHGSQDDDTRYLIIDTHIDTPYRQYRIGLNIFDGTNTGQFDLPRALQGGLSAAFMSIYTPASAATEGTSKQIAHELIDWVFDTAAQSEQIGIATCSADIRKLFAEQKLALPLGMENASPLEGDPSNLLPFIERGIRYITLAHSRSNEFSDSSYDDNETHGGLSEAGVALVKLMNQHGIMIDLSHLTDDAAWQVLEISESPVLATHSSLRHFVPGFHRNISDDMVRALKDNGGVVHINFGSAFILNESRVWQNELSDAVEEFSEGKELTTEQRREFAEQFRAERPYPFATVATVADHIDRVVELAGIDHVGLGSDYDGVGDTLPIGLKDVSMTSNLIQELKDRNYDDEALRKVLGENLMRVWIENEKIASGYGNNPNCAG